MSLFVLKPKPRNYGAGAVASLSLIAFSLGCASPGPPHAPSLNLPKVVSDLSVRRVGDRVEIHFTAPARSTDNLPLNAPITGTLCRQVDRKACAPVGSAHRMEPSRVSSRSVATWTDDLPPELTHGSPRLMAYRVELFNAAKQSAGRSDAAYTAAGESPMPVEGLRLDGTRVGVLLHWNAAPGPTHEILISREDLSVRAKEASARQPSTKQDPAKQANKVPSNVSELLVSGVDAAQNRVLDTTAKPDHAYRYTAVRRTSVQIGGRAIELSSAIADAKAFELHLIYPPPAPTGLTAAGFVTDATATAPAGFAVDLVWQPIDDAGLLAGLAGYNVYREDPGGRTRLNTAPVQVPAFHDATAVATDRYKYSVTAVDGKGNESPAVAATLEPDAKQQ